MPRQPRTSANNGSCRKANLTDTKEGIPWASGFKVPTENVSRNAIGCRGNIPDELNPDLPSRNKSKFFHMVPKPESVDDWLAQYNETGQTFKEFLKDCPWLSSRKRKYMSQEFQSSGMTIREKYPNGKIYIVPVGDFDKKSTELLNEMLNYTSIFLGLPVEALPGIDLNIDGDKVFWVEQPSVVQHTGRRSSQRTKRHELTSRYDPDSKHLQVCVDSNLMQLRRLIPADAICMIGLTMLDLYGEESDLFVAGMAAGNQRVAIFSLFRYDPSLNFSIQNWYEIEKDNETPPEQRQSIMLQRGCKLLVHEICHLLGIDHCIFYECCMNGSGHLTEDFRQPMHLCPVDLHKLKHLVGFDILDRYRALGSFYHAHGFEEEEKWLYARIEAIEAASNH